MNNFNAVTEKWIPVISAHGLEYVSLLDIFRGGVDYPALSEGPWGGLPYLNLLIVIATDACRPQSISDIQGYLDNSKTFSDVVKQYLIKHTDRFNLYGKNPFLQIGCYHFDSLSLSKPEHIRDAEETLLLEGFTTTKLRDNTLVGLKTGSAIVRALLKSLVYGCNKKTLIPGNARPNLTDSSGTIVGTIKEGQTKISPIRSTNGGTSGTLNIYVQGKNLAETIILNMISEDEVKKIWPAGYGLPIYLQDTDDHNKMVADHAKMDESFLGQLVPLVKYLRILTDEEVSNKKLDTSKVWVIYNHAEAYDYQKALTVVKDTIGSDTTYYVKLSNKKAKYTRGIIRPNSYLWKEFAEFNLSQMPLVLAKFSQLNVSGLLTIHAVGIEGSATAGLAYNDTLYESNVSFPKISDFVTGQGLFNLIKEIGQISSDISSKLYFGVVVFAKEISGDKCDTDLYTEEAIRVYWQLLDKAANKFISQATTDIKKEAENWKRYCYSSARSILEDIKDGSVRRNKAIAKALLKLKEDK